MAKSEVAGVVWRFGGRGKERMEMQRCGGDVVERCCKQPERVEVGSEWISKGEAVMSDGVRRTVGSRWCKVDGFRWLDVVRSRDVGEKG